MLNVARLRQCAYDLMLLRTNLHDAMSAVTETVNMPDASVTSWAEQARSLAEVNPNMNNRKLTVQVHGRASAS